MSTNEPNTKSNTTACYRITVSGVVDASWSDWLDGLEIRHGQSPEGAPLTILEGQLTDQSALRGLLNRLWDLNLSVLAVQPCAASETNNLRMVEPSDPLEGTNHAKHNG